MVVLVDSRSEPPVAAVGTASDLPGAVLLTEMSVLTLAFILGEPAVVLDVPLPPVSASCLDEVAPRGASSDDGVSLQERLVTNPLMGIVSGGEELSDRQWLQRGRRQATTTVRNTSKASSASQQGLVLGGRLVEEIWASYEIN